MQSLERLIPSRISRNEALELFPAGAVEIFPHPTK